MRSLASCGCFAASITRGFTLRRLSWLVAAFLLRVSAGDWCWIILAISIVWTAEALNTAFEFLADAASPEFHPLVRDAKDVAAGAVLVTAIAAGIIGAIIFCPYVARLFS
jgi:diacylglycerol kinase (ATP)